MTVAPRDLGLLVLRLGIGGTLIAHGTQKLFGWFGGAGLDKTAVTFDHIGFRPGKINAVAAGLGEAGGGALLAAGVGTPGAGAAIAGTMIVASSMHIPNGFFASNGGFEFPAVLRASAAALALAPARSHSTMYSATTSTAPGCRPSRSALSSRRPAPS